MLASKYEVALGKDEANYQPLSPIAFLERSALVYPAKPAIVDGERIITYADMPLLRGETFQRLVETQRM